MINFKRNNHVKELPAIQLIPLIDILFVILSFFMAMFLQFNFESAFDISVPTSSAVTQAAAPAQEIIINIPKEGNIATQPTASTLLLK